MPAVRTRSKGRIVQLANCRSKRWPKDENVNPVGPEPEPPSASTSRQPLQDITTREKQYEKRFRSERRANQRLKPRVEQLKSDLKAAQAKNKALKQVVESQELELSQTKTHYALVEQRLHKSLRESSEVVKALKKTNRALQVRVGRAPSALRRAVQKARLLPYTAKLTRHGAFTPEARALARFLAQSGCPREKIGGVIVKVAKFFGITIKHTMSRRSVSRAILEGGLAAKIQLGYEMSLAKSMTLSGDSTSHRKINYDSRHIALRAPKYQEKGPIASPMLSEVPSVRFLGIDSSVDHSSEVAKEGWKAKLNELTEVYNNSPLAQRIGNKLTIRHVVSIIKGMNADHASAEKSTANAIREWKKETAVLGMGEDRLAQLSGLPLVLYLSTWKARMVDEAGGSDAWSSLPDVERACREASLLSRIKVDLGTEAYNQLPEADKRNVDSFIWAGCCMHKDQNSFKGGCTAMMGYWMKNGLTPPRVLANKENAAILRRILDPAAPSGPMSELELAAFESSTRGGVKTTALAGAIFNNKDDKKGQGDSHVFHFRERYGKLFKRFPDTSNTRFNSHAEAAAELLARLDDYLKFLLEMKDRKKSGTWTNIELNVYEALRDIPTLTELAAMTLYSEAITHPYMRVVRGPGTESQNVLDLKAFHLSVREFIQGLIRNPDLLVAPTATPAFATLDGRDWNRPDAIAAIQSMSDRLPHLKDVVLEFLVGSLATWERFTAEFAPGGLIDTASTEELKAAWMPTTNDHNEGSLGGFRKRKHDDAQLTMHQYNAEAMFARNDTQAFMDATFDAFDYAYLVKLARKEDSSGLETKRRQAQIEFDLRLVEMKREKEARKKAQAIADLKADLETTLISDESRIPLIRNMKELGVQLDLLQKYGGDVGLPKTKKERGKRAEQNQLLATAFRVYQQHIANGAPTIRYRIQEALTALEGSSAPEKDTPVDGWEEVEILTEDT